MTANSNFIGALKGLKLHYFKNKVRFKKKYNEKIKLTNHCKLSTFEKSWTVLRIYQKFKQKIFHSVTKKNGNTKSKIDGGLLTPTIAEFFISKMKGELTSQL